MVKANPKVNRLGDEVLALRQEVRELREALTNGDAAGGTRRATANPQPNAPLSAAAVDQLHEAHREGVVDLADVLDEVCEDPNCPDIHDDDDDEEEQGDDDDDG